MGAHWDPYGSPLECVKLGMLSMRLLRNVWVSQELLRTMG